MTGNDPERTKMPALAVIAAPSDSLRYSLRALLAGLPQITTVQSVEDTRSLLAALTAASLRLVVLDVNLSGQDTATLLTQIATLAPHACSVVLVDQIAQQQTLQTTSADLVLLKGFPAAELFTLLERLLTQE